jgi:hypothetical protein
MEVPAPKPRKSGRRTNVGAVGMAHPRGRFKNFSCRFRVVSVTASALDQVHSLFGSNRGHVRLRDRALGVTDAMSFLG